MKLLWMVLALGKIFPYTEWITKKGTWGESEEFSMDAGGSPRTLFRQPETFPVTRDWSPDGQRAALSSISGRSEMGVIRNLPGL
ncbi:MAG: hypothetical protein AAB225_04315 [Acidobacteriota bacterium]